MALAPDEITAAFREALGSRVVTTCTAYGMATVVVEPGAWADAFRFAQSHPALACDYFTFVSAIDWVAEPAAESAAAAEPGEAGEAAEAPEPEAEPEPDESEYRAPKGDLFEMVGRVSSSKYAHGVTLKTRLPKDAPRVETLVPVFAGADWHEREAMEMFGIEVVGHPNPERLFLTDEFEGHPLLKSFQLAARTVKPWPGQVDVEPMPDDAPVRDDAGNVIELPEATPAATPEGSPGAAPEATPEAGGAGTDGGEA